MGQFLEIRDHNYRDFTLEFLSMWHVEVTSRPRYQEGHIFLYLNRDFYKVNLSAFNSILGFPPSMKLPYQHVHKEFNLNVFWNEIFGDHQYDTSNSKGTIIRNPCIQVAQRLLACGLFVREDSFNVSRLSKLYLFNSMLQSDYLDLGLSLVN